MRVIFFALVASLLASVVLAAPSEVRPVDMPPCPVVADVVRFNAVAPVERRDEAVTRYLSASFRIRNGGVSGSGTLCFYDDKTHAAYVISCAHLFRAGDRKCTVEVFYHNDKKLPAVKGYAAEVLCFDQHQDISFLKFKTDWVPDEFFPVAPVDHALPPKLISVGCDGGREVAAYDVTVVGVRFDPWRKLNDLVTKENSPRRGRSGGGLLTADGDYVGICWGSEDPLNGTKAGFFVPLDRIHAYATKQNLGWLLKVGAGKLAHRMPIVDRIEPQGVYPPRYVPVP